MEGAPERGAVAGCSGSVEQWSGGAVERWSGGGVRSAGHSGAVVLSGAQWRGAPPSSSSVERGAVAGCSGALPSSPSSSSGQCSVQWGADEWCTAFIVLRAVLSAVLSAAGCSGAPPSSSSVQGAGCRVQWRSTLSALTTPTTLSAVLSGALPSSPSSPSSPLGHRERLPAPCWKKIAPGLSPPSGATT